MRPSGIAMQHVADLVVGLYAQWLSCGWIACPMTVLWLDCMPNDCLVVGLYAQLLYCGWIACPMTVLWLDCMPNGCHVVGVYAQ